jgi:hypothetical protein
MDDIYKRKPQSISPAGNRELLQNYRPTPKPLPAFSPAGQQLLDRTPDLGISYRSETIPTKTPSFSFPTEGKELSFSPLRKALLRLPGRDTTNRLPLPQSRRDTINRLPREQSRRQTQTEGSGKIIKIPDEPPFEHVEDKESEEDTTEDTTKEKWDLEKWKRPSWWTSFRNYRNLAGSQEWEGRGVDPSWVKQGWWRSPDWPDYIIWHPYWGWQNFNKVAELYKKAGGPVSWQDFISWPLSQNVVGLWDQYFDNLQYTNPESGNGDGSGRNGDGSGQTLVYGPYEPPPGVDIQLFKPGEATSMLDIFGYTGPIPINPYEQSALDYIGQMYLDQQPLQTLAPAESFYNFALAGGLSPTGAMFRNAVYNAIANQAFRDLRRAQKMLASRFSNLGGYFGGRHALAQALLADEVLSNLQKTLADINLAGWNQNVASMFQGAGGLTGLATTKQGLQNQILQNLLTGGSLLTQREALNRAEYQNALQRAYEDWLRARQEEMVPFQMALALMGMNPIENIAQPPQPSAWSYLLGGLGSGLGNLLGYFTGAKLLKFLG